MHTVTIFFTSGKIKVYQHVKVGYCSNGIILETKDRKFKANFFDSNIAGYEIQKEG